MNFIPIKKSVIKRGDKESEVFVVPAIPLNQPDGGIKKVPHPQGYENMIFNNLSSAIETISLAGFGYTYDDKNVPAQGVPETILPDLSIAIAPLLDLLNNPNHSAVASAAYALGELRSSQAIIPLISILGKEDPLIRKNSTEALAKIGDIAIRYLIEALNDTNWITRNSASIALGEMTNYDTSNIINAVQPLTKRLQDSNWIVRSSAANSIGKIAAYIKLKYKD